MEKEQELWELKEQDSLETYVSTQYLPINTICTECQAKSAVYLCTTCGYNIKLCRDCLNKTHSSSNTHNILFNDNRAGLKTIPKKKLRNQTIWIDLMDVKITDGSTSYREVIESGYFCRGLDNTEIAYSFNVLDWYRHLNLNGALSVSAFIDSLIGVQSSNQFPSNIKDV